MKLLVLDEADEMLSLGFWPDMREINKYLPKERQACLFSATILFLLADSVFFFTLTTLVFSELRSTESSLFIFFLLDLTGLILLISLA